MNKFCAAAAAVIVGVSTTLDAAFASTSIPDVHYWKPMYDTLPAPTERYDPELVARMAGFGATVPYWRGQATSGLDGKKYIFDMVGSSPFNAPASTTIKFVPILVKVVFPGGVVLDPTKPACQDSVSVEGRLFNSPLFKAVNVNSNGVNVGTVQLTDAFQRANFWTAIKASSAYHVKLSSAVANPIVVSVNAPAGSATQAVSGICHRVGLIPLAGWDAVVRSLVSKYAKPSQLAMVSTYNVVEFNGNSCCTNGYHFAYMRSAGLQTYAVGTYDEPIFGPNGVDINTWSHEISEWYDDPFVSLDGNNMTPAWGHLGQVSGCQNNLETGDPLSGTAYFAQVGGFRYHPQDLAFLSWFYRIPSLGTGGKFSFEGTFSKAQGVCR
jgi:hypothetical protein